MQLLYPRPPGRASEVACVFLLLAIVALCAVVELRDDLAVGYVNAVAQADAGFAAELRGLRTSYAILDGSIQSGTWIFAHGAATQAGPNRVLFVDSFHTAPLYVFQLQPALALVCKDAALSRPAAIIFAGVILLCGLYLVRVIGAVLGGLILAAAAWHGAVLAGFLSVVAAPANIPQMVAVLGLLVGVVAGMHPSGLCPRILQRCGLALLIWLVAPAIARIFDWPTTSAQAAGVLFALVAPTGVLAVTSAALLGYAVGVESILPKYVILGCVLIVIHLLADGQWLAMPGRRRSRRRLRARFHGSEQIPLSTLVI